MRRGDWVHIFWEGTCSLAGEEAVKRLVFGQGKIEDNRCLSCTGTRPGCGVPAGFTCTACSAPAAHHPSPDSCCMAVWCPLLLCAQGGGKMGPVRKGVGKLVASCEQPPLVVPFVHSGMEQVMPRGKALPTVGKKVRQSVGTVCGSGFVGQVGRS